MTTRICWCLLGCALGLLLAGCGSADSAQESVGEVSAALDPACATTVTPAANFTDTFDFTTPIPYPAGCPHGVVIKVDGIDASPSAFFPPSPAVSKVEIRWADVPSATSSSPCYNPAMYVEARQQDTDGTWKLVGGALSNPFRSGDACKTPPPFTIKVPAEKSTKFIMYGVDSGNDRAVRLRWLQ